MAAEGPGLPHRARPPVPPACPAPAPVAGGRLGLPPLRRPSRGALSRPGVRLPHLLVGRARAVGRRRPIRPEKFPQQAFINPPTALPLCALCALLPFGASFLLWTAVNALLCPALLPLSQWALSVPGEKGAGPWRPLPPAVLAGLAPALLLSE